jgi:hypothetical protein
MPGWRSTLVLVARCGIRGCVEVASSKLGLFTVWAGTSHWTPGSGMGGTVDEPSRVTRARERATQAKLRELAAHRGAAERHEEAPRCRSALGTVTVPGRLRSERCTPGSSGACAAPGRPDGAPSRPPAPGGSAAAHGTTPAAARHIPVPVLEPEQAGLGRHQGRGQLLEPGRVGEVAGAEDRDPLARGLQRQLDEVGVAAGRSRIPGVQVQIGIERHRPSLPEKARIEALRRGPWSAAERL